MFGRILFVFILTAIPPIAFAAAYRLPYFLATLAVSVVAAFAIASPVSYPRWFRRALVQGMFVDVGLSLLLWFLA